MDAAAAEWRARGAHPFVIPLGASTPLGALGFARAVDEMVSQLPAPPDFIFHSTSSGGTQAGLVAGCAMHRLDTRVIGISADESVAGIQATVGGIIEGMGELLGIDGTALASSSADRSRRPVRGRRLRRADATASREAQALLAASEALVVDHTYTAKALAGMIALDSRGPRPAGRDGALLAHRRPGRGFRAIVPGCHR